MADAGDIECEDNDEFVEQILEQAQQAMLMSLQV